MDRIRYPSNSDLAILLRRFRRGSLLLLLVGGFGSVLARAVAAPVLNDFDTAVDLVTVLAPRKDVAVAAVVAGGDSVGVGNRECTEAFESRQHLGLNWKERTIA